MVFYVVLEKLEPTKWFHSLVLGLCQASVWKGLRGSTASQPCPPHSAALDPAGYNRAEVLPRGTVLLPSSSVRPWVSCLIPLGLGSQLRNRDKPLTRALRA